MANRVDPDQMSHIVMSDLGLQFTKSYLYQYLGLLRYAIRQIPLVKQYIKKSLTPKEADFSLTLMLNKLRCHAHF